MFLVVGLGNPGKQYTNTRHNLGFMVIDELIQRHGESPVKLGQKKVLLLKPETFMNNSGQAVRETAGFYKLKASQIIVAYDDVDLEVGELRLRPSGSAAGHKGVQSIIDHFSSHDFIRVRLGVGKNHQLDTADYVLSKIPATEKTILVDVIIKAADAIESIIQNGLPQAMNEFN